ncbi:DEAD/DEAH box helicase [Niallia hominis]|uniref:DEAD/DEAH box helicase family protein n=1 Tax=Niallia hominis TaxID=3133173 RepID=A0ABV1EUW6_9BACI
MNRFVNPISNRLSLRNPQRESLEILAEIIESIGLGKILSQDELQKKLEQIKGMFPSVQDFERNFPSVCFALATGVGKTRLMGAFISYLYMAKGIKNFFVLAPNLTIYEKLIQDFTPNTKKYVFKGISQFAIKEPLVINGDNYEDSALLLLDEERVKINIFNISKINTEVKGGKSPRIKRLSEYIGESYFEYLSSLPDLVLLMDESHRYRASAGVKALNELNPVLGLELTATPQVEKGKRSIPFKNVIYSYPLYKAMEDGYVKEPTVATRENFDVSNYPNEDELDRLKLADGILVHEETKIELEVYAKENNQSMVKPFILIVAQDTNHAEGLMGIIKSNDFFDGRYRDKVITVHSKQSGEEKDETIQELLALEDPNSNTEIVIHVNKLKEGWDVTNLYTIIPLRAANSKTLVEQSIGRGLRLPYGKRTKIKSVDRLTIIAHDRFQDIIDEANNPDSIIRKGVVIGRDVAGTHKRVVSVESNAKQSILQKIAGNDIDSQDETVKRRVEVKQNIAETTIRTIQKMTSIPSNSHLTNTEIKKKIVQEVKASYPVGQIEFDLEDQTNIIEEIVETVTEYIIEKTMDIPKIILQPKEELTWGFQDFDLNVSGIYLQPVTQEILLQELRTRNRDIMHFKIEVDSNDPLEDYIISRLMDFDDISYEDHADLLYKLVGQLISHLRSYLNDDNVRNVLMYNQQLLANKIHAQMLEHYQESKVEYDVVVRSDFEVLRTNTFSVDINEEVRDFQISVEDRSAIRGMSFGGFKRCLYPIQKFDAENERRFAVICEQDLTVEKWFKPALNQLKIYYNQKQAYNPDFIVETTNKKYLVELKAANKVDGDKEVEAKASAAIQWCKHATDHELQHSGKEWVYLLIPHNDVNENMTIVGLEARYKKK